jgi:hypothetical protein
MNLNLSNKQAKDVNDNDLGEVQEADRSYILIQRQTSYYDGFYSFEEAWFHPLVFDSASCKVPCYF